MAIKFDKITPGMTLLDIHSYRMGNTPVRRLGKWKVKIASVDAAKQTAIVQWNGNAPQEWTKRQLEKLYTKETKKYREQQTRGSYGGW